jgi:hypothetical protein
MALVTVLVLKWYLIGTKWQHFRFLSHDPKNWQEQSSQLLIMISGSTEMPDAMEMIFQSALSLGRHGGVSVFILIWLHLDNDLFLPGLNLFPFLGYGHRISKWNVKNVFHKCINVLIYIKLKDFGHFIIGKKKEGCANGITLPFQFFLHTF